MANRQSPAFEARSRAEWALRSVGREVRVARYRAGMTQRSVGSATGRTGAWISLVERGKAPRVALAELAVIAAAVGLRLYVNAYPAGRRPLDAPQLALLTAFNARIHPGWRRELEKVMPQDGDLRAVDELLTRGACSIAVEAVTRFADVQAQVRAARAKQRDLGAARVALVVSGSRANRRLVAEAEPLIRQAFPVGTRATMRALAAGDDPGGDCLVFI